MPTYRYCITWRHGKDHGRGRRLHTIEHARELREKLMARYKGQHILFGILAVENE
jgi:hypothetical protein